MSDAILALESLGNIRRALNLVASGLLRKERLHPKQMVMLRFVYRHKKVSLTQLAEGTATDMAAASRALGPLIRQGWLKRSRNPKDSRSWLITLTPQGRRRVPQLENVYRRLAKIFSRSLSARELKTIHTLLARVEQDVQQELHT